MTSESYVQCNTNPERARHLKAKEFSTAAISTALKVPQSTLRRWFVNSAASDARGRRRLLTEAQDAELLAAVEAAARQHQPWTLTQIREKVSSHFSSCMKI